MAPLKIIIGIVILLTNSTASDATQKQLSHQTSVEYKLKCENAEWISGFPRMQESHFESTLSMDCLINKKETPSLSQLAERIIKHLKKTRVFHSEPIVLKNAEKTRWKIDSTVEVGESEEKISVREWVAITVLPNTNELQYETQSQEITAKGMASYLKEVNFSAVFQKTDKSNFKVSLLNFVRVKRPWYAFSPVFYLIAKGVAKDKFSLSKTRLMTLILSNM